MSTGELVVDDYQLLTCIASGNSSQVWEVQSKTDNSRSAMKLLLPEAMSDPDQVKTLKHEAKVGAALDHPNIIKFHKSAFTKQHAYIVMDYFRAPNVKTQISTDHLGLQLRIRKLIEGLCLSIGYMHSQGWLHKDLKPENILFSKSSELRLIDFSLSAKHATGVGKLLAGKVKVIQGTRTYIAPETIQKQQPTPQTDMYSLGITLFEVLTTQAPFKGSSPTDLLKRHLSAIPPNPSHINQNVSPEMDRFILRMLSKKPKDRHKSMDEVYAEFRSIKVFKEDVQEIADKAAKERADKAAETFDGQRAKLSSRTDADRTDLKAAAGPTTAPAAPAAVIPPAPKPALATPAAPPAAGAGQGAAKGGPSAAASAPLAGGQPAPRGPQPQPPVPGGPMPGYGMPAGRPGAPPMPQAGYPNQGYPMPPAGMPGMPPGYGQPMYPPQGYGQPGYAPPNVAAQGQWQPPGAMPQWPKPPGQPPMPGAPQQPPMGAAPRFPPAAPGLQPQPGQPQPGQPHPGQPQPGQPHPGQPQPGQPQPGQFQPRQFQPGRPSMPPQPGAPRPVPASAAVPSAASNPAAPQQPPKPAPAPKKPVPEEELPLMEELPPIV